MNVMLGPSLIRESGIGCIAITNIRADSFVCAYEGTEFETLQQAEAAFPNSNATFDGSDLVAAPPLPVVVASSLSYGFYVNDPLVAHLVNAEIRYNTLRSRYEVWSTGSGIGYLEEVYIAYSADFWRTRTHLARSLRMDETGYGPGK